MKKYCLFLMLLVILAQLAIAQSAPVAIRFSWDNPGPQYTNITYVLHSTTNLSTPQTNWTATVLTNVVVLPSGRLASTNYFSYNPSWFMALSSSNSFWHLDSVFSNVVSPGNQIPPTNQVWNLSLEPTF